METNVTRISIVYHQNYDKPQPGGILSYLQQLIEYAPEGFTFTYWGESTQESTREIGQNILEIKQLIPVSPNTTRLPKLMYIWYCLFKNIPSLLKSTDVVFVQVDQLVFPFIFFPSKKPIVFISHGSPKGLDNYISKFHYYNYLLFDFFAMIKVKLFMTVSKDGSTYYSRLYPKYKNKIIYFPTFYDEKHFLPGPMIDAHKKLGLEDKIVISFVGRLDYQKQFELCLQVTRKLADKYPNIFLCIVGDGSLRKEMEDIVRNLHLEPYCKFYGTIERKNIQTFFQASYFSYCLSRWEGTPISVIESLGCGTPVLASNVGDNPVLITNDVNGYIVNPDVQNVDEISNYAIKIIEKHATLSKGALESSKEYRASVVVPKILKCFKDIHEK